MTTQTVGPRFVLGVLGVLAAGLVAVSGCNQTATNPSVADLSAPVPAVRDAVPANVESAIPSAGVETSQADPASVSVADATEQDAAGASATSGDESAAEPSRPVATDPAARRPDRSTGLGQALGGGGFGGGGFGGGGGVSIDPKIQLSKDASGKLDQKRQQATNQRPDKGNFSAPAK